MQAGTLSLRCALGLGGIVRDKREGDHATPAGEFRLLSGFFRADRLPRPAAPFAMRRIGARQGWCDDPAQALYNRPVVLPCGFSHERFWREDRLYDRLIVLDYNISPRRRNRGSAIFLHCCREGFQPTEGCIALDPADLRRLLPRLSRKTAIIVR
jgi:L,D-peptidoglycan transpeptidase YkuD (ErfK/YbiS/YcfS/YnhG family)